MPVRGLSGKLQVGPISILLELATFTAVAAVSTHLCCINCCRACARAALITALQTASFQAGPVQAAPQQHSCLP